MRPSDRSVPRSSRSRRIRRGRCAVRRWRLSISLRRCCRSVQTSSCWDRWTPSPDDAIIADVEAVLRESLTNVAKHAQAAQIRVRIQADKQRLDLTVIDNGIGLGQSTRRSGLANLSRRAERHGGYLDVGDTPEGGLRLQWSIPIRP